jgi:hypothetical protein
LVFSKNNVDLINYYLYDKFDFLVLVLYVNDLILTSSLEKLIMWCKKKLVNMNLVEKKAQGLQVVGTIEVWREKIGVGENTFLTKRDC